MSFLKYIKLEIIKIRSSYIKYTIILPLLLSLAMIATDLMLRKETILSQYKPIINDGFQSLLVENHLSLIWPIILMFSIIINTICLFHIDIKNNSLTHILASPISRSKYYLSKLITISLCTIISILLEGSILIIIGYMFNLSPNIDIPLVIRYMWMQLFCCFGLIGLQCFLFSLSRDPIFLISINIAGICGSLMLLRYPSIGKFSPYLQISNSMFLTINSNILVTSMVFSSILFVVLTILGLIIFNYRDIKGE